MPSLLLAGFEGLGRAAQGLPRGMAEAEKLRQEEADRALREKAFGLQERAAQRAEEDRFVDLGAMYDTLGLPRPADTRVRTPLAGPMLTEASGRAKEQRTKAEEARKLGGLAEAVQARSVTMPEPGMRAENEMPAVDPNLEALARVIPMLSLKTAEERVADQFAPKPKDPFAVADRASVFNPRTGTFTSAPRAPVQPFTPPGGYTPSYSVNPRGEATTTWKPPGEPKEPNQGQRREDRIHNYLVNVKGFRPGSPEYQAGFLALEQSPVAIEGVGAFTRTDLLNPSATPRLRVDKPVSGETTMQLVGVGRLRDAVQKIDAALEGDAAKTYFGPYAQYWALAQEKAPGQLLGQVPGEVIDLNQNLATVQNYTIRLITGAQMNMNEETRIKKELPSMGQPEYMFRRYWDTTRGNIALLEKRVVGLAMSGDQQAKAIAQELGLMPGGDAQVPVGRPPGAPPAPTATAPAGGWKIQRVK